MRKIVMAVATLMFVVAISGCGEEPKKEAPKTGTTTGAPASTATSSGTGTGTGPGAAADKK
jgi:uncharacterized protein YceK